MGYRSNVVIALSKEAYATALISDSIPSLLKNHQSKTFDRGIYWKFDYIKWYDSYDEINEVNKFLGNLHSSDFGFIRTGEEHNDIDECGEPGEFDLSIDVYIDSPFARE